MLYFDNNATTLVPNEVCVEAMGWVNVGNPSADHAGGRAARAMMQKFRVYLGGILGVTACCESQPSGQPIPSDAPDPYLYAATHTWPGPGAEDPTRYKIIFCSGASEANAMVLFSTVASAKKYKGHRPHVVASAVEHKSILMTLEILKGRGDVDYTLVPPGLDGAIHAEDVAKAIREETCLVCVMHANNETGIVNPVGEIARASHARSVPFHCDTVQTAGRMPPDLIREGIDSAVLSFHKFHGFAGAGALVIKQQFVNGYKLEALVPGTQNDGLRGGTENIIGIAAGYSALRFTMADRAKKNAAMLAGKVRILELLSRGFPCRSYQEYLHDPEGDARSASGLCSLVIISPVANCLPNTILLSVVRRHGPRICNKKIKDALAAEKCIISVGSACNTASASASHVLYALHSDEYIRAGALRISLGDSVTRADCDKFCQIFVRVVVAHAKNNK